jgi:hypothetical protein
VARNRLETASNGSERVGVASETADAYTLVPMLVGSGSVPIFRTIPCVLACVGVWW